MEIQPVSKKQKKPKPAKKAWWKFWAAQEVQPPKAIAYDRTAVPMGVVDQARKSQD
jgi:hypothetical protein